jgi:glutaconyl-CoA decarboxylase
MKKFNFKINGNEYQTTVEQSGELLQVTANGKSFTAELEKEAAAAPKVAAPAAAKPAAAAAPAAAPAAAAPAGGKAVESPLPGVVVSIAVSAGQAVKAGDTLLTLEAMKMENAIQAEADGTVAKVLVSVGQSVQSGDPLLEIA